MAVTEAHILRGSLRHNIREIQRMSGTPLCIALKADGYGHGAVEVARTAIEEGVNCFGFARLSEAVALRDAGIDASGIFFSALADDEIAEALHLGMELFISDHDYLEAVESVSRKCNKCARVHLKVDTGMRRLGVPPEEAVKLACMVQKSPYLEMAGVCTHFAVADEPGNPFTGRQLSVFRTFLDTLSHEGIDPGIVHTANSAAMFYHPETRFSMTRPGIAVYGYQPGPAQTGAELKPVMELVSTLVQIRKVAKGEAVSYGLVQAVKRDTCIGTVGIGYADGYSRSLSCRGKMAIGGHVYPLVGRICMDQCMIDLGPDCHVKRGDRVTVFGPDAPAWTARDMAEELGTISYEITCGVSARVPRIYHD